MGALGFTLLLLCRLLSLLLAAGVESDGDGDRYLLLVLQRGT